MITVEVQFSLDEKLGETLSRVGTTVDGVTEVKIPDELLTHSATSNYRIYAYIYLTDETSGNTKYEITIPVRVRSKPTSPAEDPETDPDLFRETVVAVNASAERAKMAEQNAKESATEAGKYAASASESAVTAEKTKEDALRKVGEKKREAIEAIQEQEETSVGKIVNHTDNEIQRIQNQATDSKAGLEQTITNADASKKELEHSIETAGTSKTALDKSVELAGTAKTELDTSIREAGTAKTALDESTETAGTVQETLSATVKQAGALDTSLGEEIETGTQLKTDLVASGEKAVQDIRAAGSEQLGKMQAVAEAFAADREQIAKNKEDIGSLKEDTAVLQKRQNILVGSETGNPVSCNDAYSAPLCGLTVYGKSTQDGKPTPDAPVPIVSAGDGGTIVVTLSDGNGKTQTLTLPTPTGLPGIPVTSGGNYTDQNGHRWICDEVDLDRGMMVQRVGKVEVTSAMYNKISSMNAWDTIGLDKVQPFRFNSIYTIRDSMIICTALPGVVNGEAWSRTYECIGYVGRTEVYIDFCIANERLGTTAETTRVDAIKALMKWLETNPFSFIYVLTTPIETPLTPAEITAYKALITYAPNTVAQVSDDAGIKLDYQRDVNLVVKNLEDAIASMTTT